MLNADFLAQVFSPAYFVVLLAEVKANGKGLLVCKIR